MPDVLIRGLSEAAVEAIDQDANAVRLSRNEYLRQTYEDRAKARRFMTDEDWARSASRTRDLDDPEIMAGAWR